MMKLRKNLLVGMLAALLAFAGAACDNGAEDPAEDPGAGTGTEDPLEGGGEEDPLEGGGEEDPLGDS